MKEEGIYLVFTPVNQASVADSDLNVELVNVSSYDIEFTFCLEHKGKYEQLCKEKLESNMGIEICELKRNEIGDWHSVKIELEFSGEGSFGELEPFTSVIKLKQSKFFKESSYKEYFFSDKKVICEDVVCFDFDDVPEEEVKKLVSEIQKPVLKNPEAKKQFHPGETEEVDLHIEALTDDADDMTPAEKLNYQLKVFRNKLDACIAGNRSRIIFIHGVGAGVLKKAIRKIMDEEYENVKYKDELSGKYGMGATEVRIK